MGEGQLLAAGIVALSALAPAQGPLYRERWSDLHLELRREQLLHECAGRDARTLAEVAELLAAPDGGVPFRPVAAALAFLRGREADEAFLFRTMAGAFVLPEVADPAGANADCHRVHVSLFLPYTMSAPGTVRFAVQAADAAGAQVFAATVTDDTGIDDLRMGRAHADVPTEDLPDGRYRLTVRAILDGKGPGGDDPVLTHAFHVLRGYQARAEVARKRADELGAGLPPLPRALLLGLELEVNRAYAGEAFDGESDAVEDLLRLERAVDNVAAGRPPLAGFTGLVPTALPGGERTLLGAVVPMPAAAAKRPLIVCAAAAPAYDLTARRPAAPAVRSGRWLARRLAGLGLEQEGHVVYLQSPGAGIAYAKALPAVLAALRELLPTDGRAVLVLELEAAVACCYDAEPLRGQVAGLVLVGAGTLAAPALRALGGMRILGIPLTSHPSSDGLRYTAAVADGRHGAVDWQARFALAPDRPRPWTFGAAAAGAEIRAFVHDVLAGAHAPR